MRRAGIWVAAGAALAVASLAGWLITMAAVSFAAKPTGVEDLTAAWTQSGPTPLGDQAAVTVPPGSTLVAFLVGTQLLGTAGTTTGTCTADSATQKIRLAWPVHIERSLTGVLSAGQETVAIAGWTNRSPAPVTVRISCRSSDSGVEHFVAVPTTSARLESPPWFQPWGWLALGVLGAATAAVGALRS